MYTAQNQFAKKPTIDTWHAWTTIYKNPIHNLRHYLNIFSINQSAIFLASSALSRCLANKHQGNLSMQFYIKPNKSGGPRFLGIIGRHNEPETCEFLINRPLAAPDQLWELNGPPEEAKILGPITRLGNHQSHPRDGKYRIVTYVNREKSVNFPIVSENRELTNFLGILLPCHCNQSFHTI